MHQPNPYPWIDAQLRDVPVPDRLARRLRKVALADDAGLDGELRGAPVPEGLVGRLRWVPAEDDAGLDALLCDVPVPYRVMTKLREAPGYRLKLQRIANWVVAATLLVAIGLSYFGTAMGLLIAARPVQPEPPRALAWFVTGELPDASGTELGIVRVEPSAAPGGSETEAWPLVEWPEPSALAGPAPPETPGLPDTFALFRHRLPGGLDPLLDATPYRWGVALGAPEELDHPPDWQETRPLRARGIPAPTTLGFDSSVLVRFGVFPFVPTAADESLRAVSVPLTVGTDSFEITRRSVSEGRLPPPGEIRTEEFLAALDYDLPKPADKAARLSVFLGPSPFVPGAFVLQGGVQAAELASAPRPPVHLIVAFDASAGPHGDHRLAIVRHAVAELSRWFGPDDRLSLVAFHRDAEVLAERAGRGDSESVQAALRRVTRRGEPNPAAGLAAAYSLAYRPDESAPAAEPLIVLFAADRTPMPLHAAARMERHLSEAAAEGIKLHVLAFRPASELANAQLQSIAVAGSGRLWPVDDARQFTWAVREAITGQSQRVAENVHLAFRFEPKAVPFYRLLGHEPGAATLETASVLHSGQSGTVLFDVRLGPGSSPGELLATAELTWREPGGGLHQREKVAIRRGDLAKSWTESPPPWQAAVVAAEAGELLRRSVYTQLRPRPGTLAGLADLLEQVDSELWQQPSFRDLAEVAQQAVKARPHRPGGGTR